MKLDYIFRKLRFRDIILESEEIQKKTQTKLVIYRHQLCPAMFPNDFWAFFGDVHLSGVIVRLLDSSDFDFVFVEEIRIDGIVPVHDGAEAALAVGLAGAAAGHVIIGDRSIERILLKILLILVYVQSDIVAQHGHAAHADVTTVEIVILVEVQDRVGQQNV